MRIWHATLQTTVVAITLMAGGGLPTASGQNRPCPAQVVNATGDGIPPETDVACQQTIEAFDHHSWRSFLSVTRAASATTRGASDPTKPLGTTTVPLVFESYKALWEVFTPTGATPGNWSETPPPADSPCPNSPTKPGDLILSSFSKLEDVRQVRGRHAFDGPLVAQNGTVVRYGTAFNQTAFNALKGQQLYLADHLGRPAAAGSPPSVQMPDGSIAVKSAWMILTSANTNRARYYTRKAWVRDLGAANMCTSEDVALIGLHIIHKTHNNPQWIWTSFEHVDNLSNMPRPRGPDSPDAQKPFALNDGTATAMPTANPNVTAGGLRNPLLPFNVTRALGINTRTRAINDLYVNALKAAETPAQNIIWKNYRLVLTQWPRATNNPGGLDDSMPGGSPTFRTSIANPAFETLFQNPRPTVHGCMNCHFGARDASDFLWSPVMHASQGGGPADRAGSATRDAIIRKLDAKLGTFQPATKARKPSGR